MALHGAWVSPVAAVGIVSAFAFVCFRLYGRRIDGDSDAYRIRRVLLLGLSVTAVGTFVAVLGSGVDAASTATLESLGIESDAATVAVNLMIAGLAVLIATTAGYLGALPAVLRVREVDVSRTSAARRFARWMVVVLALFVVVIFAVGQLSIRSHGSLVGAVGVMVVLIYLAGPLLARLGTATREPSPEERELLEECCADLGFGPRRLYVLETTGNRWPGVLVRGPPGRRTVFVTDRLLDAYDRAAVGAVLAANVGRARRFYTEYRLAVSIALLLASYWALTAASNPALAIGAITAVGVVLLWIGSRLLYAADDDAAGSVGRDAVVETYRRIADDADVESAGRIGAFLRMRPPMDERIERLGDDRTT